MTEPTKAEIMLDSVTKSNRLINYLRFCKEHPIPPLRLDLRQAGKPSGGYCEGPCPGPNPSAV